MPDESHISVRWLDRGREPQCAPDPEFPDGKDVDMRTSAIHAGCPVKLPYPAKRCGLFVIECKRCGLTVALTTAGRPDDPRSVTLPCQRKGMN